MRPLSPYDWLSLAANVLNVILLGFYVWLDYGRGFLTTSPDLLNTLFIACAWTYIVNGFMYLYLHEGELPWPSGWAMWSDWLNTLGNLCFAGTCLLYSSENTQEWAVKTVLLVETLAAFVNGTSAICGFAGWFFDEDLEEVGTLATIQHVLTTPDTWAHFTNFVPALVYMGSAMSAYVIHAAQLANAQAGQGTAKMPNILKLTSQTYWYGDIIWLGNGVLWLILWYRDQCAEEEDGEGEGGEGADEALVTPRKRQKRKHVRDVVPYRLYFPFLRLVRHMCSSREAYLELRGSAFVASKTPHTAAAVAVSGSLNGEEDGNEGGYEPPSSPKDNTHKASTGLVRVEAAPLAEHVNPIGMGRAAEQQVMSSGRRVLKLVPVASQAHAVEGSGRS